MFTSELMRDLREAYAQYGEREHEPEGLCGIFVGSMDDDSRLGLHSRIICDEVEFPPVEGVKKTKMFLGMWWNSDFDQKPKLDNNGKPIPFGPGEWKRSPCQEAAYKFLDLAARLGASLPYEIHKSVEGELSLKPSAVWCLLLFREYAQEHGYTPGERDHKYVTVWGKPFKSSWELAQKLMARLEQCNKEPPPPHNEGSMEKRHDSYEDKKNRMEVDLRSGRVRLDDTWYEVTGNAALLLDACLKSYPKPVCASRLEGNIRSDRIKPRLPDQLKEIFYSARGQGCWIDL